MSVEIIAEIGQNHQGSIDIAKAMIDIAVDCGVDTVKFQKWTVDAIAEDWEYTGPNSFGRTYKEHRRALDLSYAQLNELQFYLYDRHKGRVRFLVSAVDEDAASGIANLQMLGHDRRIKIPSCRLGDEHLRVVACRDFAEVVLSTGMHSAQEIEYELNEWIHEAGGAERLSVLHCISEYPATRHDLAYIRTIAGMAPWKAVGYSGHDVSIDSSLVAVSLGATIVEKHFTLSRGMKGSDHKASLEPREMKDLVTRIRATEMMFGDGSRVVSDVEWTNREKLMERCAS
jgi:sialic acid synthase SpsE